MAQFIKHFVQDLTQDIKIRQCGTIVFNADNESNVISVDLYNGTEPYSGGGTVAGAVICPDGATVALTGTLSGNVASVTLTGDCFAIPGQIGVGVQVISSSIRTTVLKAIYNVELLSTDNMVDPDSRITASVTQLVADIEAATAEIPASDMASLMSGIAPTFSASTNYAAGAYVYYSGTLYRFTSAHAAGSWTGTDATAVALGNDLGGQISDLKSALYVKKADTSLWTVGSIGTNDGINASQSKRLRIKTYVPDNVKGISFDNEYSGVVYAYNPADNDSYVGAWTGSGFSSSVAASWLSGEVVFATLSSNNYKYRVVIKNSGGTAMSASEAVNAPFIYVADDTLAVTGAPADAKKVGDELSTLNTKIDSAIDDAFQANMQKVDASAYPGNLENIEFPSVISSVDDLLRIEKTYCVLHDNFSRADNASEIGSNGSGDFTMSYSSMGSTNLNVGISNKTAVSSGGSSGDVAFRTKTLDGLPYKACMSISGQGALVISPADASNYIKLSATPNAVSIAGVGNAVCTAASVEHNGNCSDVTAYVYHDKIRVYVADEFVLETAATVANSVCGLFFAYGESNAYISFELFLPTNHIPVGIDNAIEKCGAPSATFLGYMAQADPTYGITFDSENTNHSLKSIRFEQKKEHSMGGTYRSEITPPYMRRRNYPLQSKVFSFDVYFPDDYDYDSRAEVLWQMHHTPDNVNPDAMYPNIAFGTYQGHMQISTRTYADKASVATDAPETVYDLGEVVKEKWRHFDVYLREGYLASHNPVTAVYMDGECVVLSHQPNGYNTTQGSYLKMGMYKSAWTSETTETTKRVVYFDNIKIWQ